MEKYDSVIGHCATRHLHIVFSNTMCKCNVSLTKSKFQDMKTLLLFVDDLALTLREMYVNGAKPILGRSSFDDKTRIERTAEEVLLKLTSAYESD